MRFSEIAGHTLLKKKLINAYRSGRIGHAQLFLGEEGSGNLPLSIAYAQYISCQNKSESDSCGTCNSCVKYEKLVHPDLHFIFPTATTPKITKNAISSLFMDQWREVIREDHYLTLNQWMTFIGANQKQGIIPSEESNRMVRTLALKSYESEYKVVIIWLAEKLNLAAGNKLLKMIEEPPDKTLIFLVSENSENILSTILSRTQLVRVGKLTREEMSSSLKKLYPDLPIPGKIMNMADGNFLKGKKLMEHKLVDQDLSENFRGWTRYCYKPDIPALIAWTEEIATKGREHQKLFLDYGLHVFRECLMINYGDDSLGILEENEVGFANKFAPFVHMGNCEKLIENFSDASYHIERNAHPKILFLDLSLKVTKLLRIKNVNLSS